jgi:hypothetical protein
VQQLLELGF